MPGNERIAELGDEHLSKGDSIEDITVRHGLSTVGAAQPTEGVFDAVTDPLASAAPLMQISMGFWAFKTLAAAHELDLFTRLSGKAGIDSKELAKLLGIHERPAEMLLTACAALGLLSKQNGRYRNTPPAEEFLVRGKLHYFGAYIEMLDKREYPGWAKLADAIRTNRPTTWDPKKQNSLYESRDPEMLHLFWEAMHSLSTLSAGILAKSVDFTALRGCSTSGAGPGHTT